MPAQESTAREVELKHPPATKPAASPGAARVRDTSIISSFSISVGFGGGSISGGSIVSSFSSGGVICVASLLQASWANEISALADEPARHANDRNDSDHALPLAWEPA